MAETRYVLELHSSTRLLPANVERERALQAALDTSTTGHVELYPEYLDVPRFSGEAYSRTVATFLREKYSAHPPEVVIIAGEEALEFGSPIAAQFSRVRRWCTSVFPTRSSSCCRHCLPM